MDFGKILGAEKIPIVALLVLGLISIVLNYAVQMMGIGIAAIGILAIWGILNMALSILIVCYAGYIITKKNKMGLIEAGVGGVITSLVPGIIIFVLNLILMVAGVSVMTAQTGAAGAGVLAIGIGAYVLGAMIVIVAAAILGFIDGIIGGFVGQKF